MMDKRKVLSDLLATNDAGAALQKVREYEMDRICDALYLNEFLFSHFIDWGFLMTRAESNFYCNHLTLPKSEGLTAENIERSRRSEAIAIHEAPKWWVEYQDYLVDEYPYCIEMPSRLVRKVPEGLSYSEFTEFCSDWDELQERDSTRFNKKRDTVQRESLASLYSSVNDWRKDCFIFYNEEYPEYRDHDFLKSLREVMNEAECDGNGRPTKQTDHTK